MGGNRGLGPNGRQQVNALTGGYRACGDPSGRRRLLRHVMYVGSAIELAEGRVCACASYTACRVA